MEKISLAISPCPNDTFTFEHFINDNNIFQSDVTFLDIQELNQAALNNKFDLIKISFAMLPKVIDNYSLLKVGSALGFGTGPLLIAKKNYTLNEIKNLKIVLPGKFTTANLLFNYLFKNVAQQTHIIFSEIENAILNNQADAGVIIHENRFTYQHKGLVKIADLGALWEQETKLPIPLGCLVIKKRFTKNKVSLIETMLQESITKARKNLPNINPFIKEHAQELSDEVIKKHIDLYVNKFTYELDEQAKHAINKLIENAPI